jgi:hypothetical protein
MPAIKYNWNNVDWSKKNTEIAAELGAPISYVSMKRTQHNNTKKVPDPNRDYNPQKICLRYSTIKLGQAVCYINDGVIVKGRITHVITEFGAKGAINYYRINDRPERIPQKDVITSQTGLSKAIKFE